MNKVDRSNLSIERLSKKYGNLTVLSDINLTLHKGEFNTIFGISGSGKSTLLKIISGIEKMDIGIVYFEEEDISNRPAELRNIGFVFQKPLLFPHMTVKENIAFGLRVKKFKSNVIDKKVNQMIALLEIEALQDQYPHELSGGQQQRVAIGRALASEPRLLLLDEPFNGLDQKLRYEMGKLIKSIQKTLNLTIVFVTHDVDECLRLSDRIAILSGGQILQHDQSNRVYYQPISKQVAELMGPGNWLSGEVNDGVFVSKLGRIKAPGYVNGKYALFIRPHQLELTEKEDGVLFKVKEIEKIGKLQRITMDVANQSIVYERMDIFDKNVDLTGLRLRLNVLQVNLTTLVG